MMILLAGLKIAAARAVRIGDDRWRDALADVLARITLPMLKPVLVVVLIFRTIDALKVFDLIWVITAGGPGSSSETLYVYAYNQAFKYLDLGYGSAVIVVFTAIVCGRKPRLDPRARAELDMRSALRGRLRTRRGRASCSSASSARCSSSFFSLWPG